MKTLNELNLEYQQLAEENPERTAYEYGNILAYSKNDASTKTDKSYIKTAYIPKILRQSDIDKLSSDMELFINILKKIVKRFFEDSNYRSMFHFTPEEEKLVLQGRYERCFLPMARFDIFYNDETGDYKFCEMGTDGASAMNEERELHIGQERFSSAYRQFRANYKTTTYELFDSWVETVLEIYSNVRGTDKKPVVSIADYIECATINEFHIFAQAFERAGIKVSIDDVRNLSYDGNHLFNKAGDTIDVVYRRAVTADVLERLDESAALISAAKDDKVLLLGDFHTQIIHNKAISVMLHAKETYEMLSDVEIAYLKNHFPYTKFYEPGDREIIIKDHNRWVVKPADGYASRGVFAGIEYTKEEWRKIVPTIPTDHYILQEYCEPYATINYGETDKDRYGKRLYHHLTGIFLYNCRFAGIYSRASIPNTFADPEDEIALPTLIVEE